MANTLKFGNGEWYGKKDTILAYNDENSNYKPLPFDFSRDSKATVINKAGLIEEVGSGQPRIDYLGNTQGALKLEPSRTNYWTYSEGSAITLNSPLGEFGFHTINNTFLNRAITYVGTINFTFIVKKIDGTIPTITTSSGSGDLVVLVSGSSAAGVAGVLTDIGNGFYKYELTREANGASVARIQNNSGLDTYVSLIQYEAGSYATSYIPTSGSIKTRAADVCSEGGNSTLFNNNSFTIFSEFIRDGFDTDSAGVALGLRNPSNSEQIRLHFDAPTKFVRFRDALNGFATIGGYIPISLNEKMKLSLSVNGSTAKVFSNGVQVGSDYTGITPFNIDEMVLNGRLWKVKDVRYYNTALTDSELATLTTI